MITELDERGARTDQRLSYLITILRDRRRCLAEAVNTYLNTEKWYQRELSTDVEVWAGVMHASMMYDTALNELCHHIRSRYLGPRVNYIVADLLDYGKERRDQ